MKRDLLNSVQMNSLRITLRRFEENLIHTQAWLGGYEENGVLYQRKLYLSTNRREQASQVIRVACEVIKDVRRDFDLPIESENAVALIRGEMSISWGRHISTLSILSSSFTATDGPIRAWGGRRCALVLPLELDGPTWGPSAWLSFPLGRFPPLVV